MAIFHLSVKTVSRGKGQSIIAKAAYNARENLRDEQTGETKDYTRAAGLLFSGIFAPKDAPAWAQDREALWNEVERNEKRKDAQFAREITLGLPHELTDEQRRQLLTDFVREQVQRKGMVADVSIHVPSGKGDDRNHHAHVLLTMREIGPEGFGAKVREWNSREQLETWREGWERTQNRYLERHGHEARVDRRTLDAQGIEREPTTHLGPHAHAMEHRRGIETERGDIHRESFTAQQETAKLKRELNEIGREIAAFEREAMRPPARETQTLQFRESARAVTERVSEVRSHPAVQPDMRRIASDTLRVAGPVVNRGVGLGVRAASLVFGIAASAFESLISPPRTPTLGEVREVNERQVAAGAPRDPALEKFLYEEEFRYIKEKYQDQAQRSQTEREQYERLKRNEMER